MADALADKTASGCARGEHDFCAPVVIRNRVLWGALHAEVAVAFCRRCGAWTHAGWAPDEDES